jgi:hypothetical protein
LEVITVKDTAIIESDFTYEIGAKQFFEVKIPELTVLRFDCHLGLDGVIAPVVAHAPLRPTEPSQWRYENLSRAQAFTQLRPLGLHK